ncbi:MAG: ATP-binding cassette domain-containing protein, partial [Chlorobiales bacterium]|nr:ATP-binding cassette domain-containing protein [Chlorobiales bacterium]
ENLSPEKSVLQEMLDSAPSSEAQRKVRDILGCFLFSGDAVEKKTGVLSGGEKSRVALAKILLQASNLLIMDEPTNHLDMRSKEMLIDSLENYDGTLLIVSHDRYFLDSLVNKVFEIKNGRIQVYLGTYAEYLEKAEKAYEEERKQLAEEEAAKAAARKAAESKKPAKPVAPKGNRKKIEAIEKEIQRLEDSKRQHEEMMAQASFYDKSADEARKATEEYQEVCRELEALYVCWEEEAG